MRTSKEAREELARRKSGPLKALEDMTEFELIEEGFRLPFAFVPDWSKSEEERDMLFAMKTKQSHFDVKFYKATENSVKALNPMFRQPGTRRTVSETVMCQIKARLKCQLS